MGYRTGLPSKVVKNISHNICWPELKNCGLDEKTQLISPSGDSPDWRVGMWKVAASEPSPDKAGQTVGEADQTQPWPWLAWPASL